MKKMKTGRMMRIRPHGLKMKRMMVGRDNRWWIPMKLRASFVWMTAVGAIKINMIIRNVDCNSMTGNGKKQSIPYA